MSVLYKALARASKARETLRADTGPAPQLPLMGRKRPRRRWLRIVLYAWGASLVVSAGGFLLFGDQMLSGLDQLAVNVPPAPLPGQISAPAVRKLPAMAQQPVAAAPEPEPQSSQKAAPVEANVQVAPAPAASDASAASPAAPPPAAAPSVNAPPPGPAPIGSGPIVIAALPPAPPPPANPVPAPAPTAAVPPGAVPAPAKIAARVKTVQPDEDLPAVLDRIRRERTSPAVAEAVTVDRRTTRADLTGRDGASAISVTVAAQPSHEDVNTAYDLLLHGRYESALGLYDKVLKASPKNLPALLGKATAEHKLRRLIDARDSYRRVLAVDPENREALTNMTAIVADQAPDQALSDLQGLQKAYPSFSPVSAQIAAIEARRDNVSAAIVALNGAIAQSPDNGLYRLNLAILQDRAGMSDEAASSYRMALEILSASTETSPVPLDQVRSRLRYLQGR